MGLKYKCIYIRLPITGTLTNLNDAPSQNKVDFLHVFTLILPSVTWTLDNSNPLLAQSNFCFPSDHFYIILLSITWTKFYAPDKLEKKRTYTGLQRRGGLVKKFFETMQADWIMTMYGKAKLLWKDSVSL